MRARARAIAVELANGPTWAIRWTKLSINQIVKERVNHLMEASMALEQVTFATADHREATTAFIREHRDGLVAPRDDVSSDAALAALLLYVTDPYAPPWRNGRTLAATFPIAARIERIVAYIGFELEYAHGASDALNRVIQVNGTVGCFQGHDLGRPLVGDFGGVLAAGSVGKYYVGLNTACHESTQGGLCGIGKV